MSWSAPHCHHCHASSPTRYENTVAYGPSFAFAVGWLCHACRGRTLELCTIGPAAATPERCLNCGGSRINASGQLDDRCDACDASHQALVARVQAHCELPPRADKINALRDLGLYRVAFNAVLLRLQANPDDIEALAIKAKLLLDVHRPAQAVPLLRQIMALDPQPDAHIDLGVALAESGHYQAAALVYHGFLITYRSHEARGVVLSNLGGCLSALGRRREAEDYHRQAIIADPDHLGPRWNLFANLNAQGREVEAMLELERTLALPWLEPRQRENIHAFRSELLINLGRLHEALAAVDASLVSDPNEPERLFTRGRILYLLGRLEQARDVLLRLLKIWPDSEAVRELLARINEAQGVRAN
jgi:tetratricopeptide (TPR) repeat protein